MQLIGQFRIVQQKNRVEVQGNNYHFVLFKTKENAYYSPEPDTVLVFLHNSKLAYLPINQQQCRSKDINVVLLYYEKSVFFTLLSYILSYTFKLHLKMCVCFPY